MENRGGCQGIQHAHMMHASRGVERGVIKSSGRKVGNQSDSSACVSHRLACILVHGDDDQAAL
jgi:hypothetical protein